MCAVKDFTATHAEGDMCGERLHGTCGDMWSKKERADPTASICPPCTAARQSPIGASEAGTDAVYCFYTLIMCGTVCTSFVVQYGTVAFDGRLLYPSKKSKTSTHMT